MQKSAIIYLEIRPEAIKNERFLNSKLITTRKNGNLVIEFCASQTDNLEKIEGVVTVVKDCKVIPAQN